MLSIFEKNYQTLAKLFGQDLIKTFPNYLRFESKSFMPLTFDLVYLDKSKAQYAMAHWYEQNGDLIQDPEMVIEIKGQTVEALSIQHAPPFNRVWEVYPCDRETNRKYVNLAQKRDQNRFLKDWFRNINDQGFALLRFSHAESEQEMQPSL